MTDISCAKLGAGYWNWGVSGSEGNKYQTVVTQVLRCQQTEGAAVEGAGLFALLPDCSTSLPVQILKAMMAILPLYRTDILFISKYL